MRLTCVVAVLTVAATDNTKAQQEPPLYRLGQVVVSADRPVSESSATLRIVSAEDIEASGARTLDEALDLLPGVDVRTGGQGVPRIDYRGFRPRHMLLLLDGIPFNAAYDGQADPSLIPAEHIAMIKVLPGTGSVLYGEGGLAGVINVITKRGAGGINGSADVEAREGHSGLVRATGGGGSERISFFGSGSAQDMEGFLSTPLSPALTRTSERGLRGNSDHRRANLFGNLTGMLSPGIEFGFAAMYVNASYGIPPQVIDDPKDAFANRVTYDRMEANEGGAAQLALSWNPRGPFSTRSWGYVNHLTQNPRRYDDATYSGMDDPAVKGTYDEHDRITTTGGSAQLMFEPRGIGRLTLELSAVHDAWNLDLLVRDVSTGSGSQSGNAATFDTRRVRDDRTVNREGVALEYDVRPMPNAGLTAGMSRHWMMKDAGDTDASNAAVAGAFYEISKRTRVRAATARRIHFPTLRQLYDTDSGNPDLRTERANIYEAGLEQTLPAGTRASVTVFRNDVDDYIERAGQGGPFQNYQAYRFTGAELTLESEFAPRLHVRSAYTFLDTEDRSPGADGAELQYRPRHRFSAEARYRLPSRLLLYAAVRHVGRQAYYSRKEPVTRAELPAWTLADARITRRLLRDRIEASLGVDNVFDVAYEEQYGNPQRTRTLYASLRVNW